MAEVATAPVHAVPVRALCDVHETRPDPDCTHCQDADRITAWWRHEQGRCDPDWCEFCAFEAGPGYV